MSLSSAAPTPPIRLGLLFGGRSAEHEVSLQSARNILEALDKARYTITLIGIDRDGRWYHDVDAQWLLAEASGTANKLNAAVPLMVQPGAEAQLMTADHQALPPLDVVFPVLHGTYGEDGAVQGLLRMAGIPFVGSGVLGSAAGMDKELMKRLLVQADIPTAPWVTCRYGEQGNFTPEYVQEQIGDYPWFVKPANLGSSVGIHKIKGPQDFSVAIKDAFRYDHKILIEKGLDCREIECAVLGNESPQVSVPGEVQVQAEFYSYEAKYIDADGASLHIPAVLHPELVEKIKAMALKTFQVLEAEGLARVDCFLTPEGEVFMNEINTLPGFTRISMYPKLWEASGIGYSELLDRLIDLALKRAERERSLKTDF